MTEIKICGNMTLADAQIINQTHPDFAGFVFAKGRHQISPQIAGKLRSFINQNIKTVGVFVNSTISFIQTLFNQGIIQIAQLHGDESEAFVRKLKALGIPTIKVFKPKQERITPTCSDYQMVDSGNGSGRTLNWEKLKNVSKQRLFLAGGLRLKNELKAIQMIHPYSLDVSSGVEVNGHKDLSLVQKMVKIAHCN